MTSSSRANSGFALQDLEVAHVESEQEASETDEEYQSQVGVCLHLCSAATSSHSLHASIPVTDFAQADTSAQDGVRTGWRYLLSCKKWCPAGQPGSSGGASTDRQPTVWQKRYE